MFQDSNYQFIHPTKTGGTALAAIIRECYYPIIKLSGNTHNSRTWDYPNPIMVVRNPYDRFISMFNYWNKGSVDRAQHKRPDGWVSEYDTIDTFISIFSKSEEEQEEILRSNYTWPEHFAEQSNWIRPEDYSRTIIIKYESDLEENFNKLISYLKITPRHSIIKFNNVSKKLIKDPSFTQEQKDFIQTRYSNDFKLWDKMHSSPEEFRHVVK